VSTLPRLELRRRRDLGELLAETLALYRRHLWKLLAISAAVVVPVQLIVSGFGLEQLTSDYDPSPSPAVALVPIGVAYLITTPLVTAMTVHLLHEVSGGRSPSARAAILAGLEAFTPLFPAVLLAAAGIVIGLFLLIVPGVYLAVRWYFVPQAVVIDGARRADALLRSGELVRGSWWRVLAIALLTGLLVGIPAELIQIPFDALADSADSAAPSLAGATIGQVLAAPAIALVSILLYYDLLARREV
jgi:hypothetical protein